MLKKIKSLVISGFGVLTGCLLASPVLAADGITLPTTVDLQPILTYGGTIVGALVGMIVLRKAIKTTNRS